MLTAAVMGPRHIPRKGEQSQGTMLDPRSKAKELNLKALTFNTKTKAKTSALKSKAKTKTLNFRTNTETRKKSLSLA